MLTDLSLAPAGWSAEGVEDLGPGLPDVGTLVQQAQQGLARLGALLQDPKAALPELKPPGLPRAADLSPRALLEAKLRQAVEAKRADGEK